MPVYVYSAPFLGRRLSHRPFPIYAAGFASQHSGSHSKSICRTCPQCSCSRRSLHIVAMTSPTQHSPWDGPWEVLQNVAVTNQAAVGNLVPMYFHIVGSAPPGRFIEQELWDKMHVHVSYWEILANSVPEGLCLLGIMCESRLPQPYPPSELSHYLICVSDGGKSPLWLFVSQFLIVL